VTPRIGLLCGGVLVAWHQPHGPMHCVGVVESRDFRRDASQAEIVRDAAFERAMSAVWDAGDGALAAAVDRIGSEQAGVVALRGREAIRDALKRRRDRYVSHWNVGATLDAASAGLARARLWRTVRGEPVTSAQLLRAVAGGGKVRYATCRLAELPPGAGLDVLELVEPADRGLLDKLLPGRTIDATHEMQRAAQREQARVRFLGRRDGAQLLPRSAYDVVEPLQGDGITGQVAIGSNEFGASTRFILDGCRLAEKRSDAPFGTTPQPLPLSAVLVAPFTPNDSWDDPAPDDLFVRAIAAMLEGLERAIRHFCSTWAPASPAAPDPRRRIVLPWLNAALELDFVRRVLQSFGFPEDELERLVPLSRFTALRPRLGVGRTRAAEGCEGSVHPTARVAIFERVGGPPVDLVTVDAEVRARGRVSYLAGQPLVGRSSEGLLLVPSPAELSVLRLVFGTDALHDVTEEWLARQREEVHERQLPETLGPDPRAFDFVPFQAEGLQGRLSALLVPAGQPAAANEGHLRSMQLRILRRGRYLGERKLWMIAAPLAATVDGSEVRPDRDWTNVDDPAFVERAYAATAAALVPLVERLGTELPAMPAGRREIAAALLLEAACAPFPAPVFADAWAALRAALPFDQARTVQLRLLSYVGWMPLEDVEAALTLALDASAGDA
jgi:hypothetical protein